MASEIPLQPWFEHLLRNVAVAREGVDPEGVHQLRVAAARVDVWLRMAGMRTLRDDLRRLRRAAAARRDLDVLFEATLPPPFAQWASQERAAAHAVLVSVLDEPRTAALFDALRWLPSLPRKCALEFEQAERARVERRRRRAVRATSSVEDVHRLRRVLRRWRYAREWLGASTTRLRPLQEQLGQLNDAVVALEWLVRCPHADELQALRDAWTAEVARLTARAQGVCRKSMLRTRETNS